MPNKETYQLQTRNQAIRNTFFHYLQTGLPRMQAYAQTAEEYYLSAARIRDIVAKKRI